MDSVPFLLLPHYVIIVDLAGSGAPFLDRLEAFVPLRLLVELELGHLLVAKVLAEVFEQQEAQLLVKNLVERDFLHLLQILVHHAADAVVQTMP